MVFTTSFLSLLSLFASLAPSASARLELQPLHAPSQAADHHLLARRSIDLSLSLGESSASAATASSSSSTNSAATSVVASAVTRAAKNSALLGQYVPSWETSAASNVNWDYAGLAWWFVLETTSTGFSSSGFSLDEMTTFVADAHSNNKAALVTCGGWSGSVWFSDLVATSSSRDSFATLLVDFVDEYKFDGLDIDWEYPGTEGQSGNKVSSSDAANYLLFLKALREKLGSRLLTAAMPSAGLTGSDGSYLSDTSAFADVLNFITVMAYDNYGNSYSSTTGPNAPLATCVEDGPSDESQIEGWIKTGFPAGQILLGVPSYSHLFKTASSTLKTTTYNGQTTQSFQALASSQPSDPSYTYAELISQGYLSSDGSEGLGDWVRYFDSCTKTPALFNSQTNYWISYDDGESSALKAAYAKSMGLAGLGVYDSTGFPAHVLERVRAALVSGVASEEESASAGSSVSTAGNAAATASDNYLDSSIYLTHASKTTTVSTLTEASETATSSADDSASSTAGAAHLSLGLKVSAAETAAATSTSSGKTTASPSSATSVYQTASPSSFDKPASSSTTTRAASSGLVLKASSSSAATTTATTSSSTSSTRAETTSSAPTSPSSSSYSAHAYKAGSLASSSSSSSSAATTSTKEQSGVYTVPDGYEIIADMRTIGQSSSSSSPTGVASLAARSWSSRARDRRGRLAF